MSSEIEIIIVTVCYILSLIPRLLPNSDTDIITHTFSTSCYIQLIVDQSVSYCNTKSFVPPENLIVNLINVAFWTNKEN